LSDPRAIAQVVTAASALQGAGVTMDVSNAALFRAGQLCELYPQQYGDGSPLARAGQTVRYLIAAVAGAQLTGTLNYDSYPNPPQVEKGWIIDGRDLAGGAASATVEVTTGAEYQAAVAAATPGTLIHIPPGANIQLTATAELNAVDNVTIHNEGTIRLPATAAQAFAIYAHGSISGTAHVLSVNALEDALGATLASGGASYATGDLALLSGDSPGVGVPGATQLVTHLSAPAGNVCTFVESLADNFLTVENAIMRRVTPLLGFRFINDGLIDGTGNSNAASRGIYVALALGEYIDSKGLVSNTSGSGILVDRTYSGKWGEWNVYKCGSANESDVQTTGCSHWTRDHIQSRQATGFGPQDQSCSHFNGGDVLALKANGRGFKTGRSRHGTYGLLHTVNSKSDSNGVNFTLGSAHIDAAVVHVDHELNYGLAVFDAGGALLSHDIHIGVFKAFGCNIDSLIATGVYNVTIGTDYSRGGQDSQGQSSVGGVRRFGLIPAYTSIANTAAETALYSQVIKANTLGIRRAVRVYLHGLLLNNSGAGQTMTLRFKYGGTNFMGDVTPNIPADANSRPYRIELWLQNVDGAAQNVMSARVTIGPVIAVSVGGFGDLAGAALVDQCLLSALAAVDTTLDQTLQVTLQFGAANANLSILTYTGYAELV
jgi:hypothetical protein